MRVMSDASAWNGLSDGPPESPPGRADGDPAGPAGDAPGDLERILRDTVAVVDAPVGGLAIWHIDVGPDTELARPCGAWLLDPAVEAERVRVLVRGRPALATEPGRRVLEGCAAGIAGLVDAEATVRVVREEIETLQSVFDEEVRRSGRSLVGPAWPQIPDRPAEIGDRNADTRCATADDGTQAALASGGWLAELADAWQKVEGQRRQRDFLRTHGGADRRSLPVVCRSGG